MSGGHRWSVEWTTGGVWYFDRVERCVPNGWTCCAIQRDVSSIYARCQPVRDCDCRPLGGDERARINAARGRTRPNRRGKLPDVAAGFEAQDRVWPVSRGGRRRPSAGASAAIRGQLWQAAGRRSVEACDVPAGRVAARLVEWLLVHAAALVLFAATATAGGVGADLGARARSGMCVDLIRREAAELLARSRVPQIHHHGEEPLEGALQRRRGQRSEDDLHDGHGVWGGGDQLADLRHRERTAQQGQRPCEQFVGITRGGLGVWRLLVRPGELVDVDRRSTGRPRACSGEVGDPAVSRGRAR